jgi:E3 ubiquitin-protein ligase DOA10
MPNHDHDPPDEREQKQCRICLDGTNAESELGRLIRPCLCKGSIRVSTYLLDIRISLSWLN